MRTFYIKIFLIPLCYLFSFDVAAQDKAPTKQIKINSHTDSIFSFKPGKPNESIVLTDGRDFIKNLEAKTTQLKRFNFIGFKDSRTIESAVASVLSEARIRELAEDDSPVLVTYYPDHTGRIMAAEYIRKHNQKATLDELDRINKYIMPSNITSSDDVWPITHVIRFNNVKKKNK